MSKQKLVPVDIAMRGTRKAVNKSTDAYATKMREQAAMLREKDHVIHELESERKQYENRAKELEEREKNRTVGGGEYDTSDIEKEAFEAACKLADEYTESDEVQAIMARIRSKSGKNE